MENLLPPEMQIKSSFTFHRAALETGCTSIPLVTQCKLKTTIHKGIYFNSKITRKKCNAVESHKCIGHVHM